MSQKDVKSVSPLYQWLYVSQTRDLRVVICRDLAPTARVTIDREFGFYEFFSFLKFNEFYEFFVGWKKIRKKFVILQIIDV